MSQQSWWSGWGEPSRADFNQMAERLDWADETGDALSTNIRRLFELDREQEHEIAQLRMMVEELAGMLIDAGVVSQDKLQQRMAVRFTKDRAEKAGPVMIQCASCATSIPKNTTYFSGLGEVCSGCFTG